MMRRAPVFVFLFALLAMPAGTVANAQPAPSPSAAPAAPSAAPSGEDVPLPEAAGPEGAPDPYLWLEDVHGERAMAWVRAENAKTTAVFEKDPRYARLYANALAIVQAKDRLPLPSQIGGLVYNFW